ncbi:Class I diheme cytochrome c4 [Caenispirillum salinarum AK4]|uniref:Class I diheme cytochrome c4 n=1 Tax=Caenispirillum salinarum AK4 TaxID=1238182 RepID=K9H9S3_9PROT|nr:Class I diheme cytochrome c4 [Caenispirillum salinarum AK4]
MILAAAGTLAAAVPAFAQAQQPAPDPPAKLSTCLPCHGRDGIGTSPLNPNLAGQKALYMVKQLKAFKSGERRHDQMSLIAADLTAEDMEALSDWYAAQPAGGGNP